MIKIENTDVYGFEVAIRGMRNPLNSWDKSDSLWINKEGSCWDGMFFVGNNDLKLMKQLVNAGSDHSKFMRMITVTCDITAPRYWWTEFDTYKVGAVRNSCSTMHTIHQKEFAFDDFSHEHLEAIYEVPCNYLGALDFVLDELNKARKLFIETKDKKYWWQIIQLLPQSYNQRATVQLNYQVLRNMYHARKNHKLDEWVDFCRWVETLPYSELITENMCYCMRKCDPKEEEELRKALQNEKLTITPQSEQKTGRWEHDGGHFANRWICSQCGYKFYFEKSEAKYCPNCGAKMESEEIT